LDYGIKFTSDDLMSETSQMNFSKVLIRSAKNADSSDEMQKGALAKIIFLGAAIRKISCPTGLNHIWWHDDSCHLISIPAHPIGLTSLSIHPLSG
jgi:hypothetical protein